MRLRKFLLERYLIKSVTPYLILSFLILTGLLLLQQSGKFAEVLSFARNPFPLTLEILAKVLPGVMLFTLPMAVLVGTSTGFARMGSDSELVALRAAGLNRLRLTAPVLIFGVAIGVFAIFDAFVIAPRSVRSLRRVLARATLARLESPIQPRTFNTQLTGKVVYVRDGDRTRGEWGRVFIHWPDPGGTLRLITARKGRLDAGEDQTELVLSDAVVTTLAPPQDGSNANGQIITERSDQLRLKINSGRDTLAAQLERDPDEDELGWGDLMDRYRHGSAKTRREALASLCKRLALALTPIPFVLLGVGLGARARRGGRAVGAVFSLFAMVLYYLIFLGGDYLSRTGKISPIYGSWAAAALALAAGLWLMFSSDARISAPQAASPRRGKDRAAGSAQTRGEFRRLRLSLLGLLDRSVLTSLTLYFLLSLTVLVAVFLLFTFFETLRLAAARGTPTSLIPIYLLYLLPFATTAVVPIATMLSVLTTYALMARRNEAMSWWSTGQSFYRLALPSLVFSLLVCAAYYGLQERLLPEANRKQNSLRSQIRGEPVRAGSSPSGVQWLAVSDGRIYSYKYRGADGALEDVSEYLFDDEGVHLREVDRAQAGRQTPAGALALEGVSSVSGLDDPDGGVAQRSDEAVREDNVQFYLFKPMLKQPNEYKTAELRNDLRELSSPGLATPSSRLNALRVALWKRRLEPLNSLVMWINALPLALAFGRRSVIRPLALAVFLGLCFWLGSAVLSQAGTYGLISPQLAALALPSVLFLSGIYLLSKART